MYIEENIKIISSQIGRLFSQNLLKLFCSTFPNYLAVFVNVQLEFFENENFIWISFG